MVFVVGLRVQVLVGRPVAACIMAPKKRIGARSEGVSMCRYCVFVWPVRRLGSFGLDQHRSGQAGERGAQKLAEQARILEAGEPSNHPPLLELCGAAADLRARLDNRWLHLHWGRSERLQGVSQPSPEAY